MVSARFPRGEGRRIGEVAAQLGLSRSAFIRQLVRAKYVELRLSGAVDVEEKKQPPV